MLLMTHKVHAKQNRRRLRGASTASEGHSTLLPWLRPPSEKLSAKCCCVVWFTCFRLRAKNGGTNPHKHLSPPPLTHPPPPPPLPHQHYKVSRGRSRGACSASSTCSFRAFPRGQTHKRTQASSTNACENSTKYPANPRCFEAKEAGVSPLCLPVVRIDSVQMD